MQQYKISYERVLGKGAYAQVFPAKHATIDCGMVVKLMLKKKLDVDSILNIEAEVKALRKLNHPNIVKFFDFFEDKRAYYLFLERINGGELFERIHAKTNYSEAEARDLCRQILLGIKHCHDHNIVHRDIKPENLMMVSPTDDSSVRIVDFGFACDCIEPTLTEVLGTPIYMAPELWLAEPYGKPVDMWSFGIISYCILSGYLPFHGDNYDALTSAILGSDINFTSSPWNIISEEAKDFIKNLLQPAQANRLSAANALEHPWLFVPIDSISSHSLQSVTAAIANFKADASLKLVFGTVLKVKKWLNKARVSSQLRKSQLAFHGTKDSVDQTSPNDDISPGITNPNGKTESDEINEGVVIPKEMESSVLVTPPRKSNASPFTMNPSDVEYSPLESQSPERTALATSSSVRFAEETKHNDGSNDQFNNNDAVVKRHSISNQMEVDAGLERLSVMSSAIDWDMDNFDYAAALAASEMSTAADSIADIPSSVTTSQTPLDYNSPTLSSYLTPMSTLGEQIAIPDTIDSNVFKANGASPEEDAYLTPYTINSPIPHNNGSSMTADTSLIRLKPENLSKEWDFPQPTTQPTTSSSSSSLIHNHSDNDPGQINPPPNANSTVSQAHASSNNTIRASSPTINPMQQQQQTTSSANTPTLPQVRPSNVSNNSTGRHSNAVSRGGIPERTSEHDRFSNSFTHVASHQSDQSSAAGFNHAISNTTRSRSGRDSTAGGCCCMIQ